MNRKYSLGIKVAAIILSVLTLAATVGSIIATVVIADAGLYTSSLGAVQNTHLRDLLENRCLNAVYRYVTSGEDEARQSFAYQNFCFTVTDESGKVLIDTRADILGTDEPRMTHTEDYVIFYSDEERTDFSIYTAAEAEYIRDHAEENVRPLIDTGDGTVPSPAAAAESETLTVTGYLPKEFRHTDSFSMITDWLQAGYNWRFLTPLIGVFSLLLNIILYIFLLCSAGHHPGMAEAVPNVFDKIPMDVHAAVLVLAGLLYIHLYPYYDAELSVIFAVAGALVGYLLLLHFTMSFATRVKVGTVFRGTLIWRICSLLWRILRHIGNAILTAIMNLPILIGTLVLLLLGGGWSFVTLVLFANGGELLGLLLWLAGGFFITVGAIYLTICLNNLKKGAERIAAGELTKGIDDTFLIGPLRAHARTLNHISDGLSNAVEERLKSERFRTELITNVSHDLKTPLTSIVNYIDLIKKENIEDPTVCGYIEVLDRQSARLKKLTEDLVEASKASTGNLEVSPVLCDLSEFLAQCAGEYEERLTKSGLQLIVRRPEYPVTIYADGRHLWRIFDNLLNNVSKYAQPGTRVYLNLEEIGGKAAVIFRNTSRYELNVSGDELMERFVRGDSSRHTDGSGLGLSIARSLTELQHGTMGIFVDGDLFKIVLTFTITDKESAPEENENV